MATYEEWNNALAKYFTAGAARGSKVYLNVDDDSLRHIRKTLLASSAIADVSATEDFCRAVREQVVKYRGVNLNALKGRTKEDVPKCVAFLGAMVLAAARMGETKISCSNDYFTHLRDVLQTREIINGNRPEGMPTGCEEKFWLEWNRWLQRRGFLATATSGEGAETYRHYPISQSLLRQTEKDKLRAFFADCGWPAHLDSEQVITRLRWRDYGLTSHLREVFSDDRAEAVADPIYELYEERIYKRVPDKRTVAATQSAQRPLIAGLLRRENWFSGEVLYHLYPRRQPHHYADEGQIVIAGTTNQLVVQRARWFEPISTTVDVIAHGASYPVSQPHFYSELMLPKREFWILVPDPENDRSGEFASWGSPGLGTHFILLLKKSLARSLEPYRRRLIDWQGDAELVPGLDGWVELCNCEVVGMDWDTANLDENLREELRPRHKIKIGLSGGLRAPQAGWLQGHGPIITVFGVSTADSETVEVTLYRIRSDREYKVSQHTYLLNESQNIEWPGAGFYRLEARCGGSVTETLVSIQAWDEMCMNTVENEYGLRWGQWSLCGGVEKKLPAPVGKGEERV
jgi:hypothetical protein